MHQSECVITINASMLTGGHPEMLPNPANNSS